MKHVLESEIVRISCASHTLATQACPKSSFKNVHAVDSRSGPSAGREGRVHVELCDDQQAQGRAKPGARVAHFTNAETPHSDPSSHTVRHTASPHCQILALYAGNHVESEEEVRNRAYFHARDSDLP